MEAHSPTGQLPDRRTPHHGAPARRLRTPLPRSQARNTLVSKGRSRLMLVTCTGPYPQGSGYRDRPYVTAAPASLHAGDQAFAAAAY
ncbi:hypothetical protein GCM10010308_51250 [Streptomyces vinaceusdrappus]|nr:hypothetical protein GCM10010308_51250 [Streptomyces vinaceusdrappus]